MTEQISGYVTYKNVKTFMILFMTKNNIKFNEKLMTDDNVNSFILEYKEEKKNNPSPKKIEPTLNKELYLEWSKKPHIDIYERIYKYTGEKIANALKETGINPKKYLGTTNYSKKKEPLTRALIEMYKNGKLENMTNISVSSEKRHVKDDDNSSIEEDEFVDAKDTDEDEDEDEDEEPIKNLKEEYTGKTLKELKLLCKERSIELDKTAKKEDMVNLLVVYDIN